MHPEAPPADLDVPWLWEGVERGWSRPETVGWAFGALARQLALHPNGDDEDRFLVRALISLEGPRSDRVWADAERQGSPTSLRSLVTDLRLGGYDFERQGLAAWCSALRHDYAHAFEITPAEFYERCLPHYHGFLHAWTDEDYVRKHFKRWEPWRQARFQHEFLLYAANDASFAASTNGPVDDGLQEAAAWLVTHRRCLFRWTFIACDVPEAVPAWLNDFEGPLIEDLEALRVAVGATPEVQWLLPRIEEIPRSLFNPPAARSPLQETLYRLGAGDRGKRRAHVFEIFHEFVRPLSGPLASPAGPALASLRLRLDEVARLGW